MVRRRCTQLALVWMLALSVLFGFAEPGGAAAAGACSGDVAVVVDARLDSNRDRVPNATVSLPGTLSAGTYLLTVVTSDGYADRVNQVQPAEQVLIGFVGGPTVGPTTDLVDAVVADQATSQFEVTLTEPVDTLLLTHVLSGTDEYNSVVVDCLALTAVSAPVPAVEMVASLDCSTGSVIVDVVTEPGLELVVETDDAAIVVVTDAAGVAQASFLAGDAPFVSRTVLDGEVVAEVTLDSTCPAPGDSSDEPDGDGSDGGGDGSGGDGDGSDGDGSDGDGDGSGGDGSGGDGSDGGGDGSGGDGDGSGGDGSGGDGDGSDGDGSDGDGDGGDGSDGDGSDPIPGSTPPPAAPPVVVSPPVFTPALFAGLDCGAEAIEVQVSNEGDAAGELVVTLAAGALAERVELAAESTTTVSLPLPSRSEGNAAQVVAVTADGQVLNSTVLVDCLGPAIPVVDVAIDCAARAATVTVRNAGGETLDVTAFAERLAVLGSSELLGGTSQTFNLAIDRPQLSLRVVDGSGTDIYRETLDHGCTETDVVASLSFVCPAAEVQLRLDNGADEARVVRVGFGDSVDTVELAANEQVLLVRSAETIVDVSVTSALGDVLLREDRASVLCESSEPGVDCEPPADDWRPVDDDEVRCGVVSARLVVDCLAGILDVEVSNESPNQALLEIRQGVDRPRTVEVAARSTLAERFEGLSDEGAIVVRRADQDLTLLVSRVSCPDRSDGNAAVLSGLLIGLMTILALVVARFDPWIRV